MTARTHRLTGRLQVPLARADAFALFTPLGEREWVHGWDPHFPHPVRDDSKPGTAFETDAHGRHTIWVVTARQRPRHISYARFTSGDQAGTVSVVLEPDGEHTQVEVTYVLPPFTPSAEADLQQFADGYPAYLESWEHAISARLSRRTRADSDV
ncbi:MAG TPA: SRPBCC domain-containing protein [Microbacteriaceae bacterium]